VRILACCGADSLMQFVSCPSCADCPTHHSDALKGGTALTGGRNGDAASTATRRHWEAIYKGAACQDVLLSSSRVPSGRSATSHSVVETTSALASAMAQRICLFVLLAPLHGGTGAICTAAISGAACQERGCGHARRTTAWRLLRWIHTQRREKTH
jgi:hypothetical protein